MRFVPAAALALCAALVTGAAAAGTPSVRYRADQPPGSAAQVERGRALFANCQGCHSDHGEGVLGMAPRLNSGTYLAIVSNDYLRKTITFGRAGTNMIAWGAALKPDDIDALVAFVRSWQTMDGITLDESPLAGEATSGFATYNQNCARCHGGAGAGYSASGPGTGIGRRGFLDVASNGMIRAIVANGKTETPMQPFNGIAPSPNPALTREQVDSIIQYMRANAW